MMDTAVLNPVTLPLNKVCLIEASAGTGGKLIRLVRFICAYYCKPGKTAFPSR